MRRFLQMLAMHPTFALALLSVIMLDPINKVAPGCG
jgi:hypothetical protein